MVKYRDVRLRGPLAMRLRYQSIRMAKAMLNDAESVAMMRQTRSRPGYVPRDDAPVPLVNDADVTRLRPAKAPLLKKLGKAPLAGFAGRELREDALRHDEIRWGFERTADEGARRFADRQPQVFTWDRAREASDCLARLEFFPQAERRLEPSFSARVTGTNARQYAKKN